MHIAITGNIGAGKTTLAEKLAKHYGWEVYYEAVDGNPYLAPFYGDMPKWSFHLQIFFLNSRFEQVLKIKNQEEKTIIQDRTIYEDAYIFAQNLYESGHMNQTDYETYKSLFNTIMKAISPPDLMIYLKADVNKLVSQIKKRNRDYEQNIDPQYLISLNSLYEGFTKEYNHGKLLEIDVNQMDFVGNDLDFKHITEIIEKNINIGTQLEI
ncbi:deoxynucleoside kinase [Lacihabitans sp. LS3-19]|uniref:deoxynucleoside kinase n=1 Tax=Lacihabitans sp. LS3-19 TaxID=2487335 RepID=UPI0020CD8303|nr:deoxynucleoside kinase [Lacihabitans sp. LS3-19]MCP9768139.1 deoxynucleoside kinase [Lacihabitans sp. LS3-19]